MNKAIERTLKKLGPHMPNQDAQIISSIISLWQCLDMLKDPSFNFERVEKDINGILIKLKTRAQTHYDSNVLNILLELEQYCLISINDLKK